MPLESFPGPSRKTCCIRSIPIRLRNATSYRSGRHGSRSCSTLRRQRTNHSRQRIEQTPEKNESSAWIARPALCLQPRDGKLFVFMPPVEYVADYFDLVAAIEETAASPDAYHD